MDISSKTPDWRAEIKRLEGAYAKATIRSYNLAVGTFVTWCDARSLQALPASPETISAFIEDQAKTCAVSTIRNRLCSIRKIHRLLRLPDTIDDEQVNLSIRRVRRAKFERPKQAKGLTREHQIRFIAAQPPTPPGIRDAAIIALGYDILARRSELVALKISDIEYRGDGTARVIIRRSKADPFGSGRFAFTSRKTTVLLQKWLGWRGDHIEYLFCPIYQGKALNRSLNATAIKRVIKRAATLAGFDEHDIQAFSSHSMRVGAAQDLLCAGYDQAAIMRAGGWKSTNVLARYLENAEHNVWE